MSFGKSIKDFYERKKDLVWFLGIIVVLFVIYQLVSAPTYMMQASYDSSGGGYARNTLSKGVSAESIGMMPSIAPIPPVPGYDEAGYFPNEEQRIRKTAYVNSEVEKQYYEGAKDGVNNVIDSNKGFYVSKNEYKNNYNGVDYKTFSVSFKVPKDNFESALNQVKKLGEVKSLSVDAQDLTTEYVDAKAYLDSYTKEKVRIESLLEKADTIEDIMRIEEKLTNLQMTIDQYQRQVSNIERQTDYSVISLTLEEKKPAVEEFYQVTSFREHIRNFVRGFDSIFVMISSFLAWILAGLLLYGIYKGYKWLRR
jgi:hypothetical protein